MKGLYRHFLLFKRPFHFIYFFPKVIPLDTKGLRKMEFKMPKVSNDRENSDSIRMNDSECEGNSY